MALQEPFRNLKAYSLQNGHDGEILKRRFIYEVKRPKKDKKLPVVLSKDEIKRILKAPTKREQGKKRQIHFVVQNGFNDIERVLEEVQS